MPSNYYHFVTWTGTVDSVTNPLSLLIERPHDILALFAENLVTNGVSERWLAEHGFTNRSWLVEAMDDQDGDGMPTWKEWIAGTDPTKAGSVLQVVGADNGFNGWIIIRWSSSTGRVYALDISTNFMAGFAPYVTNLPATPPLNVYTDKTDRTEATFYRIRVE